jgi:glucose-6-phosphate 1-dehydrogenase
MSIPTHPDPHVIVLFGATGDLARRKLLPGLLRLSEAGLMPEQFRLVGTSLDELDDDGFRAFAHDACLEFARAAVLDNGWDTFAPRLTYVPQSDAPPRPCRPRPRSSADGTPASASCTT